MNSRPPCEAAAIFWRVPHARYIGRVGLQKADIQGGDACIHGTGIPVWVLVNYRRLSASDTELLRGYSSLTLADLEAAWEYAAANGQEIDSAIRENEEGESGFAE
jgi:uncharacterized protein (DUF433 family)